MVILQMQEPKFYVNEASDRWTNGSTTTFSLESAKNSVMSTIRNVQNGTKTSLSEVCTKPEVDCGMEDVFSTMVR